MEMVEEVLYRFWQGVAVVMALVISCLLLYLLFTLGWWVVFYGRDIGIVNWWIMMERGGFC